MHLYRSLKNSKQVRLSAFFDAGSISGVGDTTLSDNFRYSVGAGISWVSPFGPLKLMYAAPLNEKTGDNTQALQFQFGQQF